MHPVMPFIVGCGRSGNTLLRMMLDSHPLMAIPPETEVIVNAVQVGDDLEAFCAAVTTHWRFGDLHIDCDDYVRRVRELPLFSTSDGLRELYRAYARKFGKTRFGDKTPYYAEHLELISNLFPEARGLHIIRDGRDVAASMMPLWFGPTDAAEMGRYWCDVIGKIRAVTTMPVLEVRYEALVQQPEHELRRICEFCDLEWSDEVLDYQVRAPDRVAEVTNEAQTADGRVLAPVRRRHEIHARLSRPPMRERIGAWREELSPQDQAFFMAEAGTLMSELGYV